MFCKVYGILSRCCQGDLDRLVIVFIIGLDQVLREEEIVVNGLNGKNWNIIDVVFVRTLDLTDDRWRTVVDSLVEIGICTGDWVVCSM